MKKIIILILNFAITLSAQTGGNYTIQQSVIAGGGGQNSSGGQFSVDGTIGQSAAGGALTGGTFSVTSGFWNFTDAPVSQTYEGDVSPRPNGDGFFDGDDVIQLRRFVVGLDVVALGSEYQRTDTSPRNSLGDGYLDNDDIIQTRRYVVGLDTAQLGGGPAGPPPIAPPADEQTPEIISPSVPAPRQATDKQPGYLFGKPQAAPAAFRVDNQNTSAGATLMVPIRVDTVGNEAGYTFSIAFDSMKLTNPQVVIGNGGGDVIFNANNPGQIGFSVTSFSGGTIAAANNVALVNVTFTVAAGAPSGTTPITFTDTPARRKASGVDPNNPITQPTYTGGTITISGATAADANVSGRVLTAEGRGIRNAQVKMTDTNGETRTVLTSAFGYFRFTDVAAGEIYIFTIKSKRYKFAQNTQIRSINQDVSDIEFVADTF